MFTRSFRQIRLQILIAAISLITFSGPVLAQTLVVRPSPTSDQNQILVTIYEPGGSAKTIEFVELDSVGRETKKFALPFDELWRRISNQDLIAAASVPLTPLILLVDGIGNLVSDNEDQIFLGLHGQRDFRAVRVLAILAKEAFDREEITEQYYTPEYFAELPDLINSYSEKLLNELSD
ncbi:MAG: hypothetical protein H6626_07105 [Pseudobdellovibrionaceae bacterium]|nr:hypothetical protein [Bdellovibrionales bacterium]USN48848.1 MAG: hypothetical protein H6626_07105 [Pseudobdellovibrionaceae bacterium]